ncbi:nucleotidyl transferase AbiEii/AbiGii toxin family protein [Patescibacteria group bacterium]|nr:nucleotidyl transferase AbiEii/AbiGii toxin family protein [Patescibacteria group bacterium]
MNNIISNWENIQKSAVLQGLPADKKRGLIREYLQSKFIYEFYGLKEAQKLSFIGGTALRLLRNIPRFSEDLDFDNLDISEKKIGDLVSEVCVVFRKENIECELAVKKNEGKFYFEIKFPNLLEPLKISSNLKEKLMIKIDYSRSWKNQSLETQPLLRFGYAREVLTNSLDNLTVQKLSAYVFRKETQPRDIYDIVWLYATGARFDHKFAKDNDMKDLLKLATEKYKNEGIKNTFSQKLAPFLINPKETSLLSTFGDVLKRL